MIIIFGHSWCLMVIHVKDLVEFVRVVINIATIQMALFLLYLLSSF